MGKHYLYKHTRNDSNEIFYIGIGTKTKNDIKYNKYARAYNKVKRNRYWINLINFLNGDYTIDIVFESDDYDYIKNLEKNLIKFYGRKDMGLGKLVNMTDGGDGQINRKWSDESKRNASISHKGKIINDIWRLNMSKSHIGNKSHTGRDFSKEHRENLSKAGKGKVPWNKKRKLSEEEIERIKEGIENNKKTCPICKVECDSGNYSRWHGEKCEIGPVLDKISDIKKLLNENVSLLKISRVLNIKYKLLRRLNESVFFKNKEFIKK